MYSIYALTDPRDESIRYIGMSKNVWRRYAMHLLSGRGRQSEKDVWIEELRKIDLSPLLKILEIVETEAEAIEREVYWIHYHLSLNTPLTNVTRTGKPIFKKKKYADLSQAITATKGDLITVEEIIKATGVSPYTIQRYIRHKRLIAFKAGGSWRIARGDLESFVVEAQKNTDKQN